MTTNQLTAEQKVRLTLSGSPFGEPVFRHDGEGVVRWLTGGSLPDAWVTFHNRGDSIEVRCAACGEKVGYFDPEGTKEQQARQLTAIRLAGHGHKQNDLL